MDRRLLSLSRRPLGVRDRGGSITPGVSTRRVLTEEEREHLRFVLESYQALTRHWQSLSERLIEREMHGARESRARATGRE